MEELIEVIQGLKQPGCIDYIQLGSAIVSVIASIIAVFVAIRVLKTIAENQNKIALFEKRYELFQFYRKCQSFLYAIKRDKTIEEIAKLERTSHQAVSETIRAGIKNIRKMLKK